MSAVQLSREYPLTLITGGRVREFYRLQIHPETAAGLGIQEGDLVWVETMLRARLSSGMDPGVVHAEHGWWLPERPEEFPWHYGVWKVNINVCQSLFSPT